MKDYAWCTQRAQRKGVWVHREVCKECSKQKCSEKEKEIKK